MFHLFYSLWCSGTERPMNTAESIVNTYACTKATMHSKQFMNTSITPLSTVIQEPMAMLTCIVMNMMDTKAKIMACPAIMFAKRRIINANGLVSTPNNSITGIMGTGAFKNIGTSGQNISFQYSLFPNRLMASIVHRARNNVIFMLPVTLAPPGKMGISPKTFVVKIKKNTVRRYGAYLR